MLNFRPRTAVDWVRAIWRRKYLVVFVAVAAMAVAMAVIAQLPKTYESRAVVTVQRGQSNREIDSARVTTATEQLRSSATLRAVIESRRLYPALVERSGIEAAVQQMRTAIAVQPKMVGDIPESLAVSFRYGDPRVAKESLDDLMLVFDRASESIKTQTDDEVDRLNREISEVDGRVSTLGERRAAESAQVEHELRALDARATADARKEAATSSIETLGDKQVLLERQIAEQRQQIAEQEVLVKASASVSNGHSGESYGVLLVRKAELQSQLDDYLTQYTEKNPKVAQARKQIAEIDRQIVKLEADGGARGDTVGASPEAAELRSMRRDLTRMSAELEITKRELDRRRKALAAGRPVPAPGDAPAVPVAGASAASRADTGEPDFEYDRLRTQYQLLLSRRVTLGNAAYGPAFFQLVEPPSVPRFPVGPNGERLALLALAAALVAGIGAALALELRRLPLVIDERDVEYFLGVPVVAQIPDMVSRKSIRRTRLMADRNARLLPIVAVICTALVALATAVGTLLSLAG